MLAAAREDPFDSPDYGFEIKWDGTRCVAFVEPDGLRLQNRRYVQMRERYPELDVLRALPVGTVLDGEIVVLDKGRSSFQRLAQRDHLEAGARLDLKARALPVTFMVFDLLFEHGRDVMGLPFRDRRDRLRSVLAGLSSVHVALSDCVPTRGQAYFAEVERLGLEGMVAKRLASPYLPGKRTDDWIKVKVAREAVFEVLGFEQREGNQPFASALVLGELTEGHWVYKGKVGSGLTEALRAALYDRLRNAPALDSVPADGPPKAFWKQTGLRCRVRFFEFTDDGKLRGPVFLGFET